MKVLFLSNFYPPAGNGGYEQWCQEVAEGLRARSHQVTVLTSRNEAEHLVDREPPWIQRTLHLEMPFQSFTHGLRFFTRRRAQEQENLARLEQAINTQQPDLIFIWGMWNLPRSLPAMAERLLPGKVVYYLSDYWPLLPSQHQFYWQAPAQNLFTRLPKRVLRRLALRMLAQTERPQLRLERVLFPSEYMREEMFRRGLEMGETRVIYGAIDTARYLQAHRSNGHGEPSEVLSLLYAGRLSPEKGVETAIEALQQIVLERGVTNVHLDIAGSGEQGYVNRLQDYVRRSGVQEFINFLGMVPYEQMPELYRQHDVFLFTSTWQEPFGRVLVEALASGVAVIGTATGGAGEILAAQQTGLVFPPGDASGLAQQVLRLIEHPELQQELVSHGQQVAQEKFDLQRMVREIEGYLLGVLGKVPV